MHFCNPLSRLPTFSLSLTMFNSLCTNILDELLYALSVVHVNPGDTVYVAVDLLNSPLPLKDPLLSHLSKREVRTYILDLYLKAIRSAVGSSGTILSGTFSYKCMNAHISYYHETTPSELGPFSEHIRIQQGSLRSLHPVFSVSGQGPKATSILSNVGLSAFGPCSPFGRFNRFNVKFLNIGLPFNKSLTYIHHLEQCYGATHRYNMLVPSKVFSNGQHLDLPFSAYMRWRSVDSSPDVQPLERALSDSNKLFTYYSTQFRVFSADTPSIDSLGYELLTQNPFIFSSPQIPVYIDDSSLRPTKQASSVILKLI